MARRRFLSALAAAVIGTGLAMTAIPAVAGNSGHDAAGKVNHIVVIYDENHSFDNLYGLWGSVNGQRVNGLPQANLGHTVQAAQNDTPYTCLKQNDVNLTPATSTTPGLTVQCIDPSAAVGASHFINLP